MNNYPQNEGLRRRRILAGECIFQEGDPGDYAYIIEEGEIEISAMINGNPLILNVLKPGVMFGELALVDGRTRSASAIARVDSLLTIVTQEQVNIRIESADPILRMLLFVVMSYFRSERRRLREHADNIHSEPPSLNPPPVDLTQKITEAVDLIRMESELRTAIEEKQFCLHYQPIVEVQTGKIAGFESLIRWQSPTRGFVRPDVFIGLAESTSLILPMGEWVIEESAKALKQFQQISQKDLFISINVASRQIEEPDFSDRLLAKVQEQQVLPNQIKLEILERSLFNSEFAIEWVRKTRELGFLLALDDFGTGYSSLQYLNEYHLDTLKIDHSFIWGLGEKANSHSICRAIIELAVALGMNVVAEGIETPAQATMLREMGCSLGQGYYYSRPVPLAAAIALLEKSCLP